MNGIFFSLGEYFALLGSIGKSEWKLSDYTSMIVIFPLIANLISYVSAYALPIAFAKEKVVLTKKERTFCLLLFLIVEMISVVLYIHYFQNFVQTMNRGPIR